MLNLKFVRFLKYAPLVFVPSFVVIVFVFSTITNIDNEAFRYKLKQIFLDSDQGISKQTFFWFLAGALLVVIFYDVIRFLISKRLSSFRSLHDDNENYF